MMHPRLGLIAASVLGIAFSLESVGSASVKLSGPLNIVIDGKTVGSVASVDSPSSITIGSPKTSATAGTQSPPTPAPTPYVLQTVPGKMKSAPLQLKRGSIEDKNSTWLWKKVVVDSYLEWLNATPEPEPSLPQNIMLVDPSGSKFELDRCTLQSRSTAKHLSVQKNFYESITLRCESFRVIGPLH